MQFISHELYRSEKLLHKELDYLEDLKSQVYTYTKCLEDQEGETFLGAELAIMANLYHRLVQDIQQQESLTKQTNNFVEAKRKDLIKINQDVKILEKLQKKQYQQYMLEHTAYEQQLLDEMTTARFHREHM